MWYDWKGKVNTFCFVEIQFLKFQIFTLGLFVKVFQSAKVTCDDQVICWWVNNLWKRLIETIDVNTWDNWEFVDGCFILFAKVVCEKVRVVCHFLGVWFVFVFESPFSKIYQNFDKLSFSKSKIFLLQLKQRNYFPREIFWKIFLVLERLIIFLINVKSKKCAGICHKTIK